MIEKKCLKIWNGLLDAYKQNRNIREQDKLKYDNANLKNIEFLFECVLNNVSNGESIFSRKRELKKSEDPDGVMHDIFSEAQSVRDFILPKGFKNIQHNKKNNVDFIAKINGVRYGIEVTYIRGPSFKTQSICSLSKDSMPGVYRLGHERLVSIFKKKYKKKEKQVLKHGFSEKDAIIVLVTSLEESNRFWFDHVLIDGKHPIDHFISLNKIPTVVIGGATIYETERTIFQ